MKIYVIVAVHNRWEFTRQFLESVETQALPADASIHTVIVDDGSTDATSTELARLPNVTAISGDGSLWWAGSVSIGLDWVRERMSDDDVVYLGNNDTILDAHHISELLEAVRSGECDLAGSVSFEIWPTGERHPVTAAFRVDEKNLNVINIPLDDIGRTSIDALAGRGLLLSSNAARAIRFPARSMPQHFADISATADLITSGYRPCVQVNAVSTQLERAGSSVEFKPNLVGLFDKRSSLYVPALVSFWLRRSPHPVALLWRMPARALRELRQGNYRIH